MDATELLGREIMWIHILGLMVLKENETAHRLLMEGNPLLSEHQHVVSTSFGTLLSASFGTVFPDGGAGPWLNDGDGECWVM